MCNLQFLENCFWCSLAQFSSLSLFSPPSLYHSLFISPFFLLTKDLYLNLFRAHISNPSCAKSNPFATLFLARELMHNTFAPGCWLTPDRERYHCLRIIESTESIIVYRIRGTFVYREWRKIWIWDAHGVNPSKCNQHNRRNGVTFAAYNPARMKY